MSKYNVEIQSRHLYAGPEEKSFSELFTADCNCSYADDAETDNTFTIKFESDVSRYKHTIDCVSSVSIMDSQKSSAITGTRTSATVFTRSSGTWTASTLKNYYAYCYVSTAIDSGSWLLVEDNDETTITIDGTLPASCNRIALVPRYVYRHNLQLVFPAGHYGSFYKYTLTKKVPLDGQFDWYGIAINAIPLNVDPEFIAGSGTLQNGWE